ncbi:MAG: Fuc2NAc and GlcNAc transferase [Cryomorphaceae bacterium]|jgi:Fuc2NAc and GlcNAc transferase
MTLTVQIIIAIGFVTIVLSWAAVRVLIGYLKQRKIVDTPNDRTLHQGAVPRGGGLVISASLLLVLVASAQLSGRYAMFMGLFVVVLLWALLSWWDDRSDLSPKLRFGAQIALALATVCAFGWLSQVQLSADLWLKFSWFGAFCSVFGILWMANLYNFMDGMDGLAASQTIIAAITIGFWFWQAGDSYFTLVCAVLAASSYGFLLWNWHPAKIFMGDVGSVTLGAFFATLLIIGVTRYQIPAVSFVVLFSVFVVDSSLTLIRRMVRGEKFWLPHRSHHYQRLAGLEIAHSKIVIAAIVLMLLCSLIATLCVLYRDMIGLAILAVSALLLSAIATVYWLESKAHEPS